MRPLELLSTVAAFMDQLGAEYFVTGSMASTLYGEYRTTRDVDLVVLLRYGHIGPLLERFSEPDYYLSEAAMLEALERTGMFNIIHVPSGFKADLAVTDAEGFDASRLHRAKRQDAAPGISAIFASPEDVILSKLRSYQEGGSDKHLRDIASILKIRAAELDRAYIDEWSNRLGVADNWQTVLNRVQQKP